MAFSVAVIRYDYVYDLVDANSQYYEKIVTGKLEGWNSGVKSRLIVNQLDNGT